MLRSSRAAWLLVPLLWTVGCGDNGNKSTSTGAGGVGGEASSSESAGGYPAIHPAQPQVVDLGGSVLATPKVIPIFFPGAKVQPDLEAFLGQLAASNYWTQVTSEYGVGKLTVGASLVWPNDPPDSISGSTLVEDLDAQLAGDWGPVDPNAIYLMLLPQGTVLHDAGDSCVDFDGYHDSDGTGPVYAVISDCPGFDGDDVGEPDQMTVAISHELIEASTDPNSSNYAYGQTDDADAAWTIVTEGEVADMCEDDPNAYVTAPGIDHKVQQSWSDAAARAGEDPCLPVSGKEPYFQSSPVLTDPVTIDYYGSPWSTKGVTIAVGSSKTIDVELWSSAKTSGPWKVSAVDNNAYTNGGKPLLSFSWDKTSGINGDVLHLTITVLEADTSLKGEAFLIQSDLGDQSNLQMGMVGN